MSAYFTAPADDRWLRNAACRRPGVDPDWFFPLQENGPSLSLARSICDRCPVQLLCLRDAMASEGGKPLGSRHGVYAGLTPGQRVALYRQVRERANGEAAA